MASRIPTIQLICAVLGLIGLAQYACGAQLTVASLNPIVTDLAREVGGDKVKIIELMPPGANPHVYAPSPADLRAAGEASLILAAGKGLETYIDDLEGNLSGPQAIIEVGRTIPSLRIQKQEELFVCCPVHSVGSIDPHWWHSVSNAKRAVRVLADSFSEADPSNAEHYKERARAYLKQLDQLNHWIKKEVAKIPRKHRSLCTAHTAYAYFCREYGFKGIPVQGLTTEEDPKPRYLAEVVDIIRKEKVLAVFPEVGANPKVLEAMVRETGVKTGGHLLAGTPDPADPTYIAMMKHNVDTMVSALNPAGH